MKLLTDHIAILAILLMVMLPIACVIPSTTDSCWDDVPLDPTDLTYGVQYRDTFTVYFAALEGEFYAANVLFSDEDYVGVLGIVQEGNEPWEVGYDYEVRFTFREKNMRGATIFDVHEVIRKTKTTREELPRVPTPPSNVGLGA